MRRLVPIVTYMVLKSMMMIQISGMKIAQRVQSWRDEYDFAFPPVYKMAHPNGVEVPQHILDAEKEAITMQVVMLEAVIQIISVPDDLRCIHAHAETSAQAHAKAVEEAVQIGKDPFSFSVLYQRPMNEQQKEVMVNLKEDCAEYYEMFEKEGHAITATVDFLMI